MKNRYLTNIEFVNPFLKRDMGNLNNIGYYKKG